jgi:asparagine synthase (glutamine-hydrolysing)
MCGIAGATIGLLGKNPEKTLLKMSNQMTHRGPDMGDVLIQGEIGLCHRRLSIIDLSEDGRQPMSSTDGRFSIVFNGEIYNYLELRKNLKKNGYVFKTNTDTEVLLSLYSEYGPKLLQYLRGMFAFAIWDNKKSELFIARDRIGKKPLYYTHNGSNFSFASELKSILVLKENNRQIDCTAFLDFMSYLNIPHPKSIYKTIHKLSPGHYLIFSMGKVKIHEYWDVDFSKTIDGNVNEIKDELFGIIKSAVECRLISDVPLGAFLSGGIDSSGIVALMASLSDNPVNTCTIGFNDSGHNEAVFAKRFSDKLGTNHKEHYIDNKPESILKKLIWHFDEPFSDSSMVPTYYVSKMARNNVTVVLSGDGGDESFGGYEKYLIDGYERRLNNLIPIFILQKISEFTENFTHFDVLKKVNSICSSSLLSPEDAFYVTNSFFSPFQANILLQDSIKKEVNGYDPADHIRKYYKSANGEDHLSKILYTDLKLFLPGDILVKVDRMSMANSLEVRSPLLDHEVIEFAAKIPSHLKLRRGNQKFILKEIFRPLIGSQVISRPKHGFTVPLDSWFRNELYDTAIHFLLNSKLIENFFKKSALTVIWEQHQKRRFNHGVLLWSILMFSMWLDMSENKQFDEAV